MCVRDNEREFTINMVLAQINNPKYHGEVNRYRGLSDLQDTLEGLMSQTHIFYLIFLYFIWIYLMKYSCLSPYH